MWKDPIVEEIRNNSEQMEINAKRDKSQFIRQLREKQRVSGRKVVSFTDKSSQKTR